MVQRGSPSEIALPEIASPEIAGRGDGELRFGTADLLLGQAPRQENGLFRTPASGRNRYDSDVGFHESFRFRSRAVKACMVRGNPLGARDGSSVPRHPSRRNGSAVFSFLVVTEGVSLSLDNSSSDRETNPGLRFGLSIPYGVPMSTSPSAAIDRPTTPLGGHGNGWSVGQKGNVERRLGSRKDPIAGSQPRKGTNRWSLSWWTRGWRRRTGTRR